MHTVRPLNGTQAFREIRSRGKSIEGKYFRFLFVCCHSQGFSANIGVVVAKRQGSAVQRNLIRRRVREAFRLVVSARSAKLKYLDKSLSVLLIFKGSVGIPFRQIPFEQIKNEIAGFVERLQFS